MLEAQGYNGQVRFDGETVFIERKGFMARSLGGKGSKSLPIRHITAVHWKAPSSMFRGFIQFTVGGSAESGDPMKDENTVVVSRRHREEFEVLRDAVEAAISTAGTAADVTTSSGLADELRKLADLHDAGVLTDAEFESQKARLLS